MRILPKPAQRIRNANRIQELQAPAAGSGTFQSLMAAQALANLVAHCKDGSKA